MENFDNRVARRHRRRQGGFTLIELLVVIAILGILAAIVVLNVTGTKANAENATCQSDTNSVQTAVDGYYVGAFTGSGSAEVYPDQTSDSDQTSGHTPTGHDTATPAKGDYVDIYELVSQANPYLQSWPGSGETFTYVGPTNPGEIQGLVNGGVCQTG
jgi:general secretion pathway protein G